MHAILVALVLMGVAQDVRVTVTQSSASDVQSIAVQRTPHTVSFALLGSNNTVLVKCPQRSVTGIPKMSRLIWPADGEALFDYALMRVTVFPRSSKDSPPRIKQLRLTCNGDTPKLEAGTGLKIVEKP